MRVNTTHGEMDEALLQKKEGLIDDANQTTTWVEYCLLECEGNAHRSGVPDAPSHFCSLHVHRSAHATLKPQVAAQSDVGRF